MKFLRGIFFMKPWKLGSDVEVCTRSWQSHTTQSGNELQLLHSLLPPSFRNSESFIFGYKVSKFMFNCLLQPDKYPVPLGQQHSLSVARVWGSSKPISWMEDTVLAKFQFSGHNGNQKFRTFNSFLTGSCVNALKKEGVERRNGLQETEFAFGLDRTLGNISILRGLCSLLSVNPQEPLLKHGFTVETRKYTEKLFEIHFYFSFSEIFIVC